MTRSAVVILNPAAGSGRRRHRVERVLRTLGEGGFAVQVEPTLAAGHATELAAAAAARGVETVFAYGGDGTLREAAAGLLGTSVELGFLPAGTANVMAHALGLPGDPLAAADALREATAADFDVGMCGSEPFLMQASCGLDAHVLARLSAGLKRRLGRLGVGLAALPAFWSYRHPRIELVADDRPIECSFAAVCNIPFYGGRWRMLPEARPDDGRLDLIVQRGGGRLATAGFARDLFLGRRHHLRRDVEVLPVERLEIRAPSPLPLQIDGDPRPSPPPVEIRLAAERLRVLEPRPQTVD